MKTKQTMDVEEALTELWRLREQKERSAEKACHTLEENVSKEVFDNLIAGGLARVESGNFELTPEGEAIARDVTRRYRLAERLLADVVEVGEGEVEKTACEFEHSISGDVADAICTLLGHPKMCPHGSPIPPGKCCARAGVTIESIVASLDTLSPGEKGKIAYIVTSDHPYLHKLLSLGIVPGTEVVLHQCSPSYVIRVGETQIALDSTVAKDIYVRKI